MERSLRVLDGLVAVFDAVAAVQPQSETVWRQATKYKVPRIIFVNKMDRMGADFFNVVNKIHERLGARAFPIQIPIGAEDNFLGVVDLFTMKKVIYTDDLGSAWTTWMSKATCETFALKWRFQPIEATPSKTTSCSSCFLKAKIYQSIVYESSLCVKPRSPARCFRCCAVPPLKTKVSSHCSMRSSTTCPRRLMPKRMVGDRSEDGQRNHAQSRRQRTVRCPRV